MTSVAQIVRGIIDDLSDGVSELVLLVVVMSENNSEVPTPLPVAAGIVNQTANTLASIAKELAKTDYVEFEEIVKEINSASDSVLEGTSTMDKALLALQGEGDRRKGWNGLCDACRVMSGKTIRLLQIVYGADLKRLQITADQLMQSISSICPIGSNKGDLQTVFQQILPNACGLVGLVSNRADTTENPFSQINLRKAAKDLNQSINETSSAIEKALQNPEYGAKADEELQKLKYQIARVKSAISQEEPSQTSLKPTPRKSRKISTDDLSDILNALNNLRPLGRNVPLGDLEFEKFKDDLFKLKKAIKKGDVDHTPKSIKKFVQSIRGLADELRNEANGPNKPRWGGRKLEAANDLEKILPAFILRSKGALGLGLKDNAKNNELLDAIRRLKRIGDRGNAAGDDDFANFLADLLAGLKKTQKGAHDGNSNYVDQGLADILSAMKNLKKTGERIAENNPNPRGIMNAINQLGNQVQGFTEQAKKAENGDNDAKNNLNITVPEIEKAVKDLGKITNAGNVKYVAAVERSLNEVIGAVDAGDPTRLTPSAKDLIEKAKELEEFIHTLPMPQRKKLEEEYEPIQLILRDVIKKSKEALLGLDNPSLVDEANDEANVLRVQLAKMKILLDEEEYSRPIEVEGANVKKGIKDVRDALHQNPSAVPGAVQALKEKITKFDLEANNFINKKTDPKKRRILSLIIQELNSQTNQLNGTQNPEKIELLMDGIDDAVSMFLACGKQSQDDDLVSGVAQASNLLVLLGMLGEDMDLSDLLSTAGNLGNLLRGLIADANLTAKKLNINPDQLSGVAKAAVELDQLCCRLEGRPDPYAVSLPLVEVFESAPEHLFVKVDLDVVTSFEDVVAGVAYEIHEQAKGISLDADNIAKELANLASAAKNGNRSELLQAARAAAAHISVYVKKLLELSDKIPGATTQERRLKESLHRAASGLKDMGTQLKILAAVKAATIEDSKDTDATLTILTRNLGEMLKEGLVAMQIGQVSIRK